MIARMEALLARVSNRALMVHLPRLQSELSARALAGPRTERIVPQDGGYSLTDSGIAVVPILGVIMSRADEWDEYFGITDFDNVVSRVTAAFDDPAARGVLLEIDSPGSDAAGAFDCHDALLALKTATGKPMWAIAKEMACSGAYLIASAADRIIATQTADLGSIGVLMMHGDQSAFDAKLGVKYTYITAGSKKADGNSHEPLSDTARADLETDVQATYELFAARVATARGVTVEAVKAQEAGVYMGAAAVAAKLADGVGSFDATLAAFAASLDAAAPPNPSDSRRGIQTPKKEKTMSTDTETKTPEQITAEATEAERNRVAEITEIATIAEGQGVTVKVADAISKGTSSDAIRRKVMDALAKKADADGIVVSAPRQEVTAPTESPLVKVAKAKAAAAARKAA